MTRRWPAEAEAALSQHFVPTFNLDDKPLSAAEMAAGFASHDAIAPTVSDKISADIIVAGANGKGRLIANFGVGINHIDLGAAATAGIAVSNTPGVLTDATADLALTLILMLSRRAGEGERELRAGEWQGWRQFRHGKPMDIYQPLEKDALQQRGSGGRGKEFWTGARRRNPYISKPVQIAKFTISYRGLICNWCKNMLSDASHLQLVSFAIGVETHGIVLWLHFF